MVQEVVIASVARTPIGRAFKGSLSGERPDDMVVQAARRALDHLPGLDPATLEDVVIGTASPAGMQGFNLGRVVSVALGLDSVAGLTVNRYCASSLQALRTGFHAIRSGEGHALLVGGVESCSSYQLGDADTLPPNSEHPMYASARLRSAELAERSESRWSDPRNEGLLPDLYIEMGQTAENVASLCSVTREQMDEVAALSQSRAAQAVSSGFWAVDIVPYQRSDGSWVDADDCPRPSTTIDGLAGLRPVFRERGRVTAGNSCPLSDGASAAVVLSTTRAAELGVSPRARVVATAVSGISPEIMGLGPIVATQKALAAAGMAIGDIDLVELNEAFASMVVPVRDQLRIDPEKLNVNGGAIAVGHPFGQTGLRLVSTAINSMHFYDKETALVTLCAAGGQGMTVILERMS